MIEISERRKLKTFSLLQGCEITYLCHSFCTENQAVCTITKRSNLNNSRLGNTVGTPFAAHGYSFRSFETQRCPRVTIFLYTIIDKVLSSNTHVSIRRFSRIAEGPGTSRIFGVSATCINICISNGTVRGVLNLTVDGSGVILLRCFIYQCLTS